MIFKNSIITTNKIRLQPVSIT